MRATRWLRGLAAGLLLLPLAACTGSGPSAAGATAATTTAATSPGSTTTTDAPSETPPPAAGGPARSGSGAAPTAVVGVSVQLETHPGYGRVVVGLNTPGVPAWTVAYSDRTGAGGDPVDIAGDAFLRVTLRTGPPAAGQGNQGSSSVTASGIVTGVRTLGVVDGTQQVLIGVSGGRLPFRAFALTDPGRIVIDVGAR